MAVKNIIKNSGKQLYNNSSFRRGMVYSNSGTPNGAYRVLANMDTLPSLDSASPRQPYKTIHNNVKPENNYVYPVNFAKSQEQYFVSFNYTVSEEDFVSDTINDFEERSVGSYMNMYSRAAGKEEIQGEAVSVDYDPTFSPEVSIEHAGSGSSLNVSGDTFERVQGQGTTANFSPSQVVVIDADTVAAGGKRYRLVTINAPEKGHKWYNYGGAFFNSLISAAPNGDSALSDFVKVCIEDTGEKDVYGRSLAYVYLGIRTSTTQEQYDMFNIAEILVKNGLAKVDYVFDKYKYIDSVISAQNSARAGERGVWGEDTDPLYPATKNGIVNPIDNTYLEVVAIKREFNNYGTTVHNDLVEFIQVDRLDAIGFIGRVISTETPQVKYKGLILLSAVFTEEQDVQFELVFPDNNFNGPEPDFITGSTSGFNLYNNNIIKIEDTEYDNSPTLVKGIVVTVPNEDTVVTTAVLGQTVRLNAMHNISYMDLALFDITEGDIRRSIKVSVDGFTDSNNESIINLANFDFDYIIDDKIIEFTVDTTREYTEGVTVPIRITLDNYKDIVLGKDVSDGSFSYNGGYPGGSEFRTVDITDNVSVDITFSDFDLPNYNPNVGYKITLEFHVSDYENTTKKIHSVWEKATNGSEVFSSIVDKHTFNIDDQGEVSSNDTNTWYNYKVTSPDDIILRYLLVPVVNIEGVDVPIRDSALSVTYPNFNIGTTIKTLSSSDIQKSTMIKNATRIGIFNRQICLYGDYTPTKTLFFSMFEDEFYFNYPFYSIDTDERILGIKVFNNQLLMFGTSSTFILVTESTVQQASLLTVFENTTTTSAEAFSISVSGANIVFASNGAIFIGTNNKYYDDPSNITIYKLADNIHGALANPEYLIRLYNKVPVEKTISSIRNQQIIDVDVNHINVVNNYTYYIDGEEYHSVIIFRYNQMYKYWDTVFFDSNFVKRIISPFRYEPQLGTQFVAIDNANNFTNLKYNPSVDVGNNDIDSEQQKYPIEAIIDSGFIALDETTDKRFKDILIQFNNIRNSKGIVLNTVFFIDGNPVYVGSDTSPIMTDGKGVESEVNVSLQSVGDTVFIPYSSEATDPSEFYGNTVTISGESFRTLGRTQLRIPVFGRGRVPSFVTRITSDVKYDILGYSVVYKEKSVNVRRR